MNPILLDNIKIRQARVNDYSDLANFLAFEYFIHRHLDWRSTLDWLGHQPFLIAENKHEIVAAYAAPADIPSVAWIRLFACSSKVDKNYIWNEFFNKSLSLYEKNLDLIATLVTDKWFYNLLKENQFDIHQEIIVMQWDQSIPSGPNLGSDFLIRPMLFEDIPFVLELDHLSFPPLWQLSSSSLQNAFLQSGYSSVVELDDKLIAYQISTENLSSAHLARLAVHPESRERLIGYHITREMLSHFKKINIKHITVNTQNDNIASQHLYAKCGFYLTRESYPVMTFSSKKNQGTG